MSFAELFQENFEKAVDCTAANFKAKGRKAITGVPANTDLPAIPFSKDDSMAPIFENYYRRLLEAGETEAAGAVGNLYNLFVSRGWITLVPKLVLPRRATTGAVENHLHIDGGKDV